MTTPSSSRIVNAAQDKEPNGSSPRNAAMQGASTAFTALKPKTQASPNLNDHGKANIAFIAATKADKGLQVPKPNSSLTQGSRLTERHCGQGETHGLSREVRPHQIDLTKNSSSRSSKQGPSSDVAAILAVARLKPDETLAAQTSRRTDDALSSATRAFTDESAIAPTQSLVQLFEANNDTSKQLSGNPKRVPTQSLDKVSHVHSTLHQSSSSSRNDAVNKHALPDARKDIRNTDSDSQTSSLDRSSLRSTRFRNNQSVTSLTASEMEVLLQRTSSAADIVAASHSAQRREHKLQASPSQSHPHAQSSQRNILSHITQDSLADAIVASNLAECRAPTHTMPPPPSRARGRSSNPPRQRESLHVFRVQSRTPSPITPPSRNGKLRQTMREELSSSSSDDERGSRHKPSKHIMRKHPHKHQEGSRKRWRDFISDRERKRYEGVWAANRGLYFFSGASLALPTSQVSLGMASPQNEILNLVARDIWLRSRLPGPVLEEIWSLIDGQKSGSLLREEFVVGLWLIDQRLKGRKLPVKVSDSVWESVRGLGIKIRRGTTALSAP